MTRPLRILVAGGYYHVNEPRSFSKNSERSRSSRKIARRSLPRQVADYQVELHAYVLMDNHFHLMVATPKSNLSAFMRHFNISYTAAVNRRNRRVGHLYQGQIQSDTGRTGFRCT